MMIVKINVINVMGKKEKFQKGPCLSLDFTTSNYHGQYSTYEKLGFQLVGDSKIGLVAWKFNYNS